MASPAWYTAASAAGIAWPVGASIWVVGAVPGQVYPPHTPQREARLAVLNGVWGDYLVESHNPLAI